MHAERQDGRPAVCIVHHYYYPQHGHVRRDAETLVKAGYRVTVLALQQDGQPRAERIHGVDVHRMPLAHRRGSAWHYLGEYSRLIGMTFLTLTRLHWQRRFQVVEVDNMPDVLVFSALIPKLTGARVILYIFDNMPELLMVTRGLREGHPLVQTLAWLERLSAAFADRVIVTQETARQLARTRGIPDRKVAVVLNGPDEAIFRRTPSRPSPSGGSSTMPTPTQTLPLGKGGQGGGPRKTFEIVTHGTILERFGIQVLIDALPEIARAVPEVRLTIFGDGEYRDALEERARQVGVAGLVTFGGWVPLDDLPDRLRQFDLGYVGMLCDNMLSNKLMEYVAIGLPVAAACWPTYEHYFDDDEVRYFEAGSPASLAQAVIGAAEDFEAARDRAERAAIRFRQYGWSVQQQAYRAVYADLTDPSARRAGAAPDHTEDRTSPMQTDQQQQLQHALDRLLAGRHNPRVLEAGCGSLTMLRLPPDAYVVGIDVSQRQLDRNEVLQEKILGDIQTYPLPAGTFDLIICWDVLEHVERPDLAVRNMSRALAEDGLLLLAMPNARSVKGRVTKLTPHEFHLWTYRNLYGQPLAGMDGRGPFPTFLDGSMAPPAMRALAARFGLDVVHLSLTESVFQQRLRRKIRVDGSIWNAACRAIDTVTGGNVSLDRTEVGMILRRPAHARPTAPPETAALVGV